MQIAKTLSRDGEVEEAEGGGMTQAEYIEILLNDCGIDTLKTRNAYLSSVCDREIKYLEDFHPTRAPHGMTRDEKSRVIEALKDKKAARSGFERSDD